jgi:hypothetical protein
MADLESVIIGGAIAIAGSFITQWLLEGRKQKGENRKKKAEKLEEVVAILYEHIFMCLDNPDFRNDDSLRKAAVLLNAKIEAILSVYLPHYLHTYQNIASIDISNEQGWEDYSDKSSGLIKELSKYAKREFQ